jgi:membrane protease subunit (stomatin/prohibitin family)
MGLGNFFKKQLSTVIEWTNQDMEVLVYKIQTATDEIKNASKLIVSPGQGCILVYEGKVQDVIIEQGTYLLSTDNHPFITTLMKLRQNFESEHKMGIYFFRKAELVNQRWGTAASIKYMDKVYNFPVELGANGSYSYIISQPQSLFENIIGSKSVFMTSDMKQIINSRIAPALTAQLANAGYSYRDIDKHLPDMSKALQDELNGVFEKLGLTVTDFQIQATIFDAATKERIATIADMTTESLSASEVGLSYVDLEKLRALRDAAKNEGGLAGAGLQLGAGMELSKAFNIGKEQTISNEHEDYTVQLKKMKLLLDEQIITQAEFDAKKKEILNKI